MVCQIRASTTQIQSITEYQWYMGNKISLPPRRHQAITSTTVYLSSVRFDPVTITWGQILHEMPLQSITTITLKITCLKFNSNLTRANELTTRANYRVPKSCGHFRNYSLHAKTWLSCTDLCRDSSISGDMSTSMEPFRFTTAVVSDTWSSKRKPSSGSEKCNSTQIRHLIPYQLEPWVVR